MREEYPGKAQGLPTGANYIISLPNVLCGKAIVEPTEY